MIRRVLLWDVDGTLVKTGGIGAAVFDDALDRVLGIRPEVRVRMSGKTDPQIVRECLSDMDIEETPDLIEVLLGHIERGASRCRRHRPPRRRGQGLSGCCRNPCRARLPAVRIFQPCHWEGLLQRRRRQSDSLRSNKWLDLDVGAYGSDDPDRTLLLPRATSRVAEQTGWRADPDQLWVIGDTPRDRDCARSGGVRCLLVGTGRYTADSLEGIGANAVLDDLSDTTAVVNLLTGV